MARRRADDPRTVKVRRADGQEFAVTPEAANALVAQGGEVLSGPSTAGKSADVKAAVAEATKPLEERIAVLEAELAARDELLTLIPTDVAKQLEELAADQSKGK